MLLIVLILLVGGVPVIKMSLLLIVTFTCFYEIKLSTFQAIQKTCETATPIALTLVRKYCSVEQDHLGYVQTLINFSQKYFYNTITKYA